MNPLKGFTILDCSTLLPGPLMGKLLAKKGARVVKIENPNRPDGARIISEAYYQELNQEKEVLDLDLTDSTDRKKFEELVQDSQGLIEGFRPQAKIKLGLDGANLERLNPKLAVVSLVGYPEDGEWKDRAGHDLNFQAITGLLSLTNQMLPLPLADQFAAYQGAFSMTALLTGGQGGRQVISMSETIREAQHLFIKEFQTSGKTSRIGESLFSGLYPCYRIYSAKDGRRVSVGAIEPKFWESFCQVLGLDDDVVKAQYAKGDLAKATIKKVEDALMTQDWNHWKPKFESANCCVEPILEYSELYS